MLPTVASPRPSKRFDAETISKRVESARVGADLEVKEISARVGMSHWSWYKKAAADVPWSLEELQKIGDELAAPTLWPFVDWEVGVVLDRYLGRTAANP
jgi:hypothetical protein